MTKIGSVKIKNWAFCYAMVAIAVVHFAIFWVAVNINSILMTFQTFTGYDSLTGVPMYGWSAGNFTRLFEEFGRPGSDLSVSVLNTLKYFACSAFLVTPLSCIISYFLFKKVPGGKFFRFVFFLPNIISAVVLVTVFKNIVGFGGPLYQMVYAVSGYRMPNLFNDPGTATPAILFYTSWTGFGVNMLLYQAAMNRIPEDVIEVGKLEGIGWAREMFQICLPMIWPTLSTTVVLLFVGLFNTSGPVMLFTSRGQTASSNATNTLAFWIYGKANQGDQANYGSAAGLFFTAISLPVAIAVNKLMDKFGSNTEY